MRRFAWCLAPTSFGRRYGRYEALGTLGVSALICCAAVQMGHHAVDTLVLIWTAPEARLGSAFPRFSMKLDFPIRMST